MTDDVWTPALRLYLTAMLRDKILEDQGGWEGVASWLYAGKLRADGSRLPYVFSMEFILPIIISDAAAWAEARRKP